MSALIEARGLGVTIAGKAILDAVSLRVAPGERIALLGPNGAGKSTLLDQLAGIRPPSSGEVLLNGLRMAGLERRAVAQQIAMVPQLEHAPDDLSALEVVLMGRTPHQQGFGLASDEDLALARGALKELDLEGFDGREVGTLSGGELQRVLIARALVQQPRLLLLDEPTSALDPGHALYIFHVIQRLARQGVAVIATVHDLNQAPLFAARALILHRGKLVVDDAVDAALQPARLKPVFEIEMVQGEVGGRTVLVPALAPCDPAPEAGAD